MISAGELADAVPTSSNLKMVSGHGENPKSAALKER